VFSENGVKHHQTNKQTIPGQLFFFQYSAVIARLPILGVTTKVQKNSYRCKIKTAWWCDYGILQLSNPCL